MALKLPSYNMFNVATSESETPTSTCLLLFVFILCSLHLLFLSKPYKESNNKKLNIINCSCQSQLPGGYHVEVFHFHSSCVNVEEPFHIILSVGHSQLRQSKPQSHLDGLHTRCHYATSRLIWSLSAVLWCMLANNLC